MELDGTVKEVGAVASFGTNNFQKSELVIVTPEQYPQTILIEFVQDKCSLLDNIAEGQAVKVHINIRGREWTNPQGEVKYFNSLQGWRIEAGEVMAGAVSKNAPPKNTEPLEEEAKNDLPF